MKAIRSLLSARIVRVIAECDLVVTYGHMALNPDDRGIKSRQVIRELMSLAKSGEVTLFIKNDARTSC